jgi:glycerophosphoryl diester phosphodiesterase
LKLIQLLSEDDWNPAEASQSLKTIARYADGVGPPLSLILDPNGQVTDFVRMAHAAGLRVHPYTFRIDALPHPYTSAESLSETLFTRARIDGLFTDFPDVTRDHVGRLVKAIDR